MIFYHVHSTTDTQMYTFDINKPIINFDKVGSQELYSLYLKVGVSVLSRYVCISN
jgi:hypothetical protein